jgi:hypothetical protein
VSLNLNTVILVVRFGNDYYFGRLGIGRFGYI